MLDADARDSEVREGHAIPARGEAPVRTLIIVPAFNEEDALPTTLSELRAARPDCDIVVVDDGSRDATPDVAASCGVPVLRLPFNLGVGGAVRTGLRYAANLGYDRAVVTDADGQHDPAGIAVLQGGLDAGADMVVGSRFTMPGSNYRVPTTRRLAMRFLALLVRLRTGQRFSDPTSGFRALARPVIELLAEEYPVEYLADTVEVLLIVQSNGHRIVERPVMMRPRTEGIASSRGFRLIVSYLRTIIAVSSSILFRKIRTSRKEQR